MPALPVRPSREHLRKQAKRLAREQSLQLAAAQRVLAESYGFRTWAALMNAVASAGGERAERSSPLFAAIRAKDVERAARLLADGMNPRVGDGHDLPLHLAARHGPLSLVETLIAGGALTWQPDAAGRTALDAARAGDAPDRAAIVALLDRSAIGEPAFRDAVAAIQRGDTDALAALLDAHPRLLHERNVGPDVYRQATRPDYFRDPKLFWYIANNPTLVKRMAPNSADVARVMIERGVEQEDLDYTLGLVMTSLPAREAGQQIPLMRTLFDAGAVAGRETILITAAHWELGALRELLATGHALTAPIAAALGDEAALEELLRGSSPEDVQDAFGLAVINRNIGTARMALAAGADVNAFLPVHSHSTALHQAAADNRPDIIELLIANGARTDIVDTLWHGTPLGWATFAKRTEARELLERLDG